MNKNVRFAIYTAILVVCFVSIILAIYDAVFLKKEEDRPIVVPVGNTQQSENAISQTGEETDETMEIRVANFKMLFTNQLYQNHYDLNHNFIYAREK